jgi:hypothetical protein
MRLSALQMWQKRISSEWKKYNNEFVLPAEHGRIQTFADYIYCIFKYRITYSEYFEQYKFYMLNKTERNEYITMSQAHKIQRNLNKGVRDLFWYKDRFLLRFSAFAKRDWINLTNATAEDFVRFCEKHQKFILKPMAGSRGNGIKLITIDDAEDVAALYNQLSSKNFIAEELITACKEIAEFNPDSLNTLRVVTFWNGRRFNLIGSFLRMGVKGSHIDNAHAGGVFARVNVKTGEIDTEGITTTGERFIDHPTSHKTIYGFRIPCWEDIIDTCRQAARSIPEAKIVGWDIAIRKDYTIVIIEGNHMPDFDVMQSPARQGVKREFLEIVKSI